MSSVALWPGHLGVEERTKVQATSVETPVEGGRRRPSPSNRLEGLGTQLGYLRICKSRQPAVRVQPECGLASKEGRGRGKSKETRVERGKRKVGSVMEYLDTGRWTSGPHEKAVREQVDNLALKLWVSAVI